MSRQEAMPNLSPGPDERAEYEQMSDVVESLEADLLVGKPDAELLLAASDAMHSTLYLRELYDLILEILISLTRSDGAVLLLQRPRSHHPVIFKLRLRAAESVTDLPTVTGHGFLDWLKEIDPDTCLFSDPPETVGKTLHSVVGDAAAAMRWAPMRNQGRLLGAVGVFCSERPAGDRTDTLLVRLAGQAAIALDNAILYRQAERSTLENQLLLEASRLLLSSLDLDEVVVAIMDSLRRALPYDAAGVFLVGPDGQVETIVDRGYNPERRDKLQRKAGEGLVGWVASTGKPVVVGDVREDTRYQNARESTRSEMVVPIYAADRLVGVFNLERDVAGGFYEPDLDLVHAFAQHAGVAIERARMHADLIERRRLKGELEVARKIQQNFLPKSSPDVLGYEIAGINIPSEEVGGDYYDFIHIIEGQIGIAIADSSGKGIPAALIMAAFRASLIAEIRNNYALHVIMRKVNRLLNEGNEDSRFVTSIYGVLDSKSRVFTFSNAGHDPGILRRADGSVVLLNSLGTALGVFPKAEYEERVIGLSEGDLLLFYTDGVTEAADSKGNMFEIEGLVQSVHTHAALPAAEILSAIRDDVISFAGSDVLSDDFTMVAVRVH
jgi:sigma-B regulation protein RsbU (phosphoserine phosphatase)